ncbi:sensor domain-containing diguanylate cyclase [Aidingimonas lacisalsi]|uniref:sensor domain-containing diguanylate cyclase n=1 Tax=Aidingimonas lacisalsi TaxID=2604086 RepID=UPI001F2935A3|nr:diguanylate cyclase [Aidingimonas lacisalsi]
MKWLLGTLQSRLMLGLGLGWLVLFAVGLAGALVSGSGMLTDATREHLEYEATLIAQHVERAVDVRKRALRRLSSEVQWDAPDLHEVLSSQDGMLELFDALAVISPQGRVVSDEPAKPGRVGLDVSDREYFKHLRHFGTPYVSKPFIGRASRMPLVMIAVPLETDDGEFDGVLGGVVSIESGKLISKLRAMRIGDEGYATLMTASGTILAHPDTSLVMESVPGMETHPALDLALSGWSGTAEGTLLDGQHAMQAYQQVWSADWVVGVFLPESQLDVLIGAFIDELWWIGMITMGLMIPVLWGLIRGLLAPLGRLERQIAGLGRGERESIALDTGMRELQEVAGTINYFVHERRQADSLIKNRQAFLDAVLASSPVGMFVCDLSGRIDYINPALAHLTGRELDDYRQEGVAGHLHTNELSDIRDLWQDTLATGRDFQRQFRYFTAAGEMLWVEVHVSLVRDGEQPRGYVGTVKDITQRREQEAMHRWEAEHDPLTGLLNRRGFERRLEESLVAWRKAATPAVLLMFDLDRFKPINDEGGHALGDEMLQRIAKALGERVRTSDVIARQGGDEFAVLMPGCTLELAHRVAHELQRAVSDVTVIHNGKAYRVTLSMGMTEFLDGDCDIDTVMERADAASYKAKAQGRNMIVH